jgi:quercetin dioxygenase-like cupin family protein
MSDDIPLPIYVADTKSKAVFAAEGPQPQFLIDSPGFKALVVGLEAGDQIPTHADAVAMYHFLEGTGLMTIGEAIFEIKPGVTVIAPSGVRRGMNAKTRLVFLGSKGEK